MVQISSKDIVQVYLRTVTDESKAWQSVLTGVSFDRLPTKQVVKADKQYAQHHTHPLSNSARGEGGGG
jgi:hypothetical protein